ncbi:MAG: hypothetical protein ACM31C_22110 [Acidobacteriota bacterium]
MRRWLAVLSLLAACGYRNAPRTMRYCEIAIVGGLVGVMATSAGAAATSTNPAAKDAFIAADVGFGALAIGAVVVYLLADASDVPPPAQSAQQRAQEEAWQLTKRAREAARHGDCGRVKKIAPAVKDRDSGFYDVVFMRDVAIQNCMNGK